VSTPPDPLRAARGLARLALTLPLALVLALGLHGLWRAVAGPPGEGARQVARAGLVELCLVPAGQAPRLGPGSHPAVDARPASAAGLAAARALR